MPWQRTHDVPATSLANHIKLVSSMMFSRGDDRFPFFTSTALTCPGAAVQTLVEKDSAQRLEGEPARYAAVKMGEFARLKQTQLDQALACLKELIPPPPAALR